MSYNGGRRGHQQIAGDENGKMFRGVPWSTYYVVTSVIQGLSTLVLIGTVAVTIWCVAKYISFLIVTDPCV